MTGLKGLLEEIRNYENDFSPEERKIQSLRSLLNTTEKYISRLEKECEYTSQQIFNTPKVNRTYGIPECHELLREGKEQRKYLISEIEKLGGLL